MLLVGQIERRYLADRTALVTAALMSGSDPEPTSLDEALAEFDAALAAEPERVTARDAENQAFLRALTA